MHRGAGAPGNLAALLDFLAQYYDNNANGGVGSFIYPFVNGFVVNDTDYSEEAQKTLKAGNLGGPLWQ